MNRTRSRTALILIALVACAPADPLSEGEAPEWTLVGPTVTIGVLDGSSNYQFEFLSGAWKTSDGTIIVADRGQTSLLFYDERGTFVRRVGRQGAGPGEMRYMGQAFPYRGDSIAVFDLGMRQISVFDANGEYARSFTSRVTYTRKPNYLPSQSCCQITGAFADGSFLVHPPDEIPTQPGPPRLSTLSLLRLTADGEGPDTIGTFESRLFAHDGSAPNGIRGYETVLPFLYSHFPDAVVGGNAQDNVLIFTPLGHVGSDTVRLGPPPPEMTDDIRSRRETLIREDYARRPQFYEGGIDRMMEGTYPARVPAFSHVLVDDENRIWVGDWSVHESAYQSDPAGKRYHIHNRSGHAIASIVLPPGARLTWAGRNEIITVEHDSLDVQYVRVYSISR